MRRKTAIFVGVVGCSALAWAAPALAVERFATPNGATAGGCTATEPPCTLGRAFGLSASGDVVTLAGDQGPYTINGILVFDPAMPLTLQGAPGQPLPVIIGNNPGGQQVIVQGFGSVIRDIDIETSVPFGTPLELRSGATAERVIAHTTDGRAACLFDTSAMLRDSVCWNQSNSGTAADPSAAVLAAPGGITATLRNVTAVAAGTQSVGVFGLAKNGGSVTIDAKNVIARGTRFDVQAQTDSSANADATVTLANSNYATRTAVGVGAAPVTSPTTNGNQTAPPLFAGVATGDFHPLADSPTIDAGTTDTFVGDLDLDRQARALNGTPDIGAYEFDNVAPDTQLTGGPSGITSSPVATYTFSSDDPAASFQCSLDDGPFTGCSGPGASHSTPALADGAHSFAVRAVDPAGNIDPSPASQSFTVDTKPAPPADTDPPETTITKEPRKRASKNTARFRFVSDEPGSTFECRLGSQRFKPCSSPVRFKHLDDGKQRFAVRATDVAGNTDTSAARDRWRIVP